MLKLTERILKQLKIVDSDHCYRWYVNSHKVMELELSV